LAKRHVIHPWVKPEADQLPIIDFYVYAPKVYVSYSKKITSYS
jgi:hypothetical protein